MKLASALLAALLLKLLSITSQKNIPYDGSIETDNMKAGDKMGKLTYEELFSLLMYNRTDFMLIDVRTPQEYAGGHIPAAFLVPIIDGKFEEHIDFSQLLCGKKFIVAYCRSGRRAAAAAEIIKKVAPVKIYAGSWLEWSKKNKINYVPFMKESA